MNRFVNRFVILKDTFKNFTFDKHCQLTYVIEPANWSIKWDGKYIEENLNALRLIRAKITTMSFGIRNQIIHFGSVHIFLSKNGFRKSHKSNKIGLSWFHFVPEDEKNKNIIAGQKYLDFIHTSCKITKDKLISLGVNPEKIIVISLGVDLFLFKPVFLEGKLEIKKKLGIPLNKIVIGSFQKDGVGWGEGLEAKLMKGPDTFVSVVERLSKNYPVFVLLVGPARGYVKFNLKKRNIPYREMGYLKNFREVAKYYNALDLYLITSRIEGGPKAILEAMASGVPVISTKVGMAPEIIRDGENGMLCDIEDKDEIIRKASELIEHRRIANKIISNGIETASQFSWERIAIQYYERIYRKLLVS